MAAKEGRNRKYKIRSDWESIKNDVMRKCVLAKFTQHKDLAIKLIETGDSILVEHTIGNHIDTYWAYIKSIWILRYQ